MIEEFQAYLDPVVPSWGYNGSARRYWDFIYGGKTQRLERQLHHYGSCFGGNVQANNGIATFTMLGSFRNRVFLAPLGLWLTLDAGHFSSVDYDTKHKTVRLHLAPQSDGVTVARLQSSRGPMFLALLASCCASAVARKNESVTAKFPKHLTQLKGIGTVR